MYEINLLIQSIKQIKANHLGMGLFEIVRIPETWCKENCNGNWKKIKYLKYHFEDETDAMAFKLRWF